MIQRINGRLIFTYGGPKKEYNRLIKANLKLSLLGALIGIFLLPGLAYLSTITPEKLIELTNQERQSQGLNSLTVNQLLTQAAIQKGQSILAANTFKHTINDKTFSSWVKDTGYNYSYVGENLAIDFMTSEGVMEAWNNSPLHKKNLLSPYYQETGIAAMPGKFQGQDTTVVVQIFGAPAVGSAAPLTGDSESWHLNSSLIPEEVKLFDPRLTGAENLLTRAIISQEVLPPANDKITLPADIYGASRVNTFIAQPDYQGFSNNFFIVFLSLLTAYSLIFLLTHYFLKINKLSSA